MYSNTEFLSEFSIENFDLIKAYSYFNKYTALKRGNKKLGKNILNFNLPPIKSCMNAESCKADCYAVKSYKLYKTAEKSWNDNFKLVINDLDAFKSMVINQVSKGKIKSLRIYR